ncbi:hypothetical protein R1sor_004865 [Riccia sorocarpa]|uniref:Myb/SANT-like DNA-binding domain-containing protein n=1 Tax=Riccia sorocarpa TaxID=122646 RepID=A0ABD3HLF2_9MARC
MRPRSFLEEVMFDSDGERDGAEGGPEPVTDSQNPSELQQDADSEMWPTARVSELLEEFKVVKVHHLLNGNLRLRHWTELTGKLNKCKNGSLQLSVTQVRNKIDWLKKRFRTEKCKSEGTGQPPSTWPFYDACFDLFGTSSKVVGIPNSMGNGSTYEQTTTGDHVTTRRTVSGVDLNLTPPSSTPRGERRSSSDNNSGQQTPRSKSPRQIGRGISGQALKAARKSPASKSIREVATAMKGFTEVYKESGKRKQELEEKKTMLFEELLRLKRRDMFGTDEES